MEEGLFFKLYEVLKNVIFGQIELEIWQDSFLKIFVIVLVVGFTVFMIKSIANVFKIFLR